MKERFIHVQFVTDLEQFVHTKVIKLTNIAKSVLFINNKNKIKNIKDQGYFQVQHLLFLKNLTLL